MARRLVQAAAMTEVEDDEVDLPAPEIAEQVGLALREVRRGRGWSQRRLAAELGVSQSVIGRMERRAETAPLASVSALLARVGLALAVIDGEGTVLDTWEPTDLLARDRGGRRFPAHRTVLRSKHGPRWWEYHEYFGSRPEGPQPRWTAQGFTPPEGARYGKKPRPYEEGEAPRWPYG